MWSYSTQGFQTLPKQPKDKVVQNLPFSGITKQLQRFNTVHNTNEEDEVWNYVD